MPPDWHLREVPADLARLYHRKGWWRDETLGQVLAAGLARAGGRDFRIHSLARPWDGTLADVAGLARAAAGGLRARGVHPGDVVAFQLPNWLEAAVTFYAASFLGAVLVPIVHFYGPKEVRYILGRSGARLLVTADRFRGIEFLELLRCPQPRRTRTYAGHSTSSRLETTNSLRGQH